MSKARNRGKKPAKPTRTPSAKSTQTGAARESDAELVVPTDGFLGSPDVELDEGPPRGPLSVLRRFVRRENVQTGWLGQRRSLGEWAMIFAIPVAAYILFRYLAG